MGAQALRMIDLAAFYAAVANEGLRVTPYSIDSIEQNGRAVYRHRAPQATSRSPRLIACWPRERRSIGTTADRRPHTLRSACPITP